MLGIVTRIISGIISEIFFFIGVILLGTDLVIYLLRNGSYSFEDLIILMTILLVGLICTYIGYFFLNRSEEDGYQL